MRTKDESPTARHTEQSLAAASKLPALVESAGSNARFAYEEFIYGKIRNTSTRKNYSHAIRKFLCFSKKRGRKLGDIMPRDVGEFIDSMPHSDATKKLYLSAIRHFFDILVQRHVTLLNPAATVRGPRLKVVEGKTPEIGIENARKLLESLNISTLVGLRDRAIIAIMIYTAARVSAVSRLNVKDFYDIGSQYCIRLGEKGGKSREIPCRHDLQLFIQEYMKKAEPTSKEFPLFLTAIGKTDRLSERRMSSGDISRMVKRKCRQAHMPPSFSPHSFRVTTITDLLNQGVPLEDVQHLAGHADPRTTRLYDRRRRKVTRNIVERISI